jgi:6,7-dimethyl-8-ribityllumazine synthase
VSYHYTPFFSFPNFLTMSNLMPERPPQCEVPWKIGVVASLYNRRWVQGLVYHFGAEARAISPACSLEVHWVPGSFELPLAVQTLCATGRVEAVAAFGVLLQGATAHATLVAQSITDALLQTSLTRQIPVLHEVLLVADSEQAEARCLGSEINRGIEAARAAIRMLRALQAIRIPALLESPRV